MVISYRWAGNLVYRAVGEQAPQQQGPGGAAAASAEVPRPAAGAKPLGYGPLLASAQQQIPTWETISFRLGNPRGARAPASEASSNTAGTERRGPQAVTVTVRENNRWPRTASTTLALNPFTGEALKREGFSDLSTGRQLRTWLRFLHTGQALGWGGQLVAGLACVGGLVLVWTGFALAWRRFFGRKTRPADALARTTTAPAQSSVST